MPPSTKYTSLFHAVLQTLYDEGLLAMIALNDWFDHVTIYDYHPDHAIHDRGNRRQLATTAAMRQANAACLVVRLAEECTEYQVYQASD